jgi:hypothetical protein
VRTLRRILGGNRKSKQISGEPEMCSHRDLLKILLMKALLKSFWELAYNSFGAGCGVLSACSSPGP